MVGLEVKALSESGRPAWDDYVNAHNDGTFFHLSGWKHVIESGVGHMTHYFFAEQNGKIKGILPLAHVNSILFGSSLVSTPFCVYGGILADDETVKATLQEKACALANSLQVGYLEMRNLKPSNNMNWPKKDLYVTFRKSIDPNREINMQSIPRKQRAMVRKGIDSGLKGESDKGIDRFYRAYSESVHNLGTPVFSKKFFATLVDVFRDSIDILTITHAGKPVSSVMSFFFKNQVLPYYGGGTDGARSVKANDYMYFELMCRAAERGVTLFDFGRSKKGTGSYSFKKNWGFEPEPLSYEYYLVKSSEMPDINPLNPKYQLFISLWKKMPLFAANLIGPFIAKNLG